MHPGGETVLSWSSRLILLRRQEPPVKGRDQGFSEGGRHVERCFGVADIIEGAGLLSDEPCI